MARYALIVSLSLMVLLAGCGDKLPHPTTDPERGAAIDIECPDGWPDLRSCSPLPGRTAPGGDLVLALGNAVDPGNAPVPSNASERTVFANCYETLTTVSCTGQLLPGLAASWQRLDGGRSWRLLLREGAVFWDGTAVTATSVIRSWTRNLHRTRTGCHPCPGLWIDPTGRGVLARSSRVVEIQLAEPQNDLPRLLAHPALAVALTRDGWLWPVGSGPCRLTADTDAARPDLICRPNPHHPDAPQWRSLTFRIHPGSEPRDLLSPGVDLAVIRNRRAADYYAQSADVRSQPLVWDRKHVLVLPPSSPLGVPRAALASIADVTVAESRPTRTLHFHGCRPGPCPQLHGPTVSTLAPPRDPDPALSTLGARRILHPADDPDAAALAERLAAFFGPSFVVQPTSQAELVRALQDETDAGYVLPMEGRYPTACLTLGALLAHAFWLQGDFDEDAGDPCAVAHALLDEGRVVPLADTRARLVYRGNLAGLSLAYDGTPLVAHLGPAATGDMP